jgi:hypothetical protein
MTKKDFTEVSLKILGIYMLTLSIDSFIGLIKSMPYFFHPEEQKANEDLIYLIANSLRILIYSIGFWLLTIKTSRLLTKLIKEDSKSEKFAISKIDLLQILFSISGIIIIFFAISEIWTTLTMTSLYDYDFVPKEKKNLYYSLMFGSPISKLILGLIMLLFSSTLSRVLARKDRKVSGE